MIKLQNVSKFYYSKGMIASGISKVNLELDIGEFVVITGESGGGKSTLLNVISGLDSYEEGEMYIEGNETSHYLASDFEEYRKKYIGNIFQNFNLVNSYTVYQNVELILLVNGYKKEDIKKRVPNIIKRVGLEDYMKTKVSKLSGGQKQRVAIARALAKDTDVIVADEPTGNLDSVSAEGIVKLLSEISRDKLVIVVTHNYDQFAAYATRKIKMHDGRVAEDNRMGRNYETKTQLPNVVTSVTTHKPGTAISNDMSPGSKVRLGLRNTFNVASKFILLLIVFIFIVAGVTAQYTSLQKTKYEEGNIGWNDFFLNASADRIVLKKADKTAFTEDDINRIKVAANVKSVAPNDIFLDSPISIENDAMAYDTYAKAVSEINEGDLTAGHMPEADNEVVLAATEDFLPKDVLKEQVDTECTITKGEDKSSKVKIVGVIYKEDTGMYDWAGDLYMTDVATVDMLKETYNAGNKTTITINGKAYMYNSGNPLYRIVPNNKVAAGKALASEEINNLYDNGNAKGKTINVATENIFYSQSVNLTVSDTYSKKTFQNKTGLSDFDSDNGNIFVNPTDYDTLFRKGNYQCSVYVKEIREIKNTAKELQGMGYDTLSIKDTFSGEDGKLLSIIRVPMVVMILFAIFFISYFVIRLILKSRTIYFSTLRMLGLAKVSIRRILDVEMFTLINIAYALFIGVVIVAKQRIIEANVFEYINDLMSYMRGLDYIILYAALVVMAYIISGKFARSLFKKTAMGSYREED